MTHTKDAPLTPDATPSPHSADHPAAHSPDHAAAHSAADSAPHAGDVAARRKIILGIGIAGIAVAVIGTATRLIVTHLDPGGPLGVVINLVRSLTYPNAEGNLWSWFSALMIALLGVAFFLLAALLRPTGTRWRVYIALGAIALYLSLDETAQIHENFARGSQALGLTLDFAYDWLILGVPFALVVGAFALWLSRHIDRTLRWRLILGGSVYLLGAAVLEAVCGFIANTADLETDLGAWTAYQLVMMLEESAEFLGVLIAFAAVLAMVRVERTERGAELIPRLTAPRHVIPRVPEGDSPRETTASNS